MIHTRRRPTSKPRRKSRATKTSSRAGSVSPIVYVLSDSTGNLARHTLAAVLTQFPPGSITTRYHSFIRTEQRLAEALDQIRRHPGAVCHAFVSDAHKQKISEFCNAAGLAHYDLTAGMVAFLSQITQQTPRSDLSSIHRIDDHYKRRIGAIEFTLTHDDGLGLSTLAEADIVLAGVSRTGKTPTSIYLAQQGYRVANVSLAMEVPPAVQLLSLPKKKVVGLIISPQQLVMIRARRAAGWRMDQTSYGRPSHVAREIAWARQLFASQGWPILDVTDQAIEETAAKIIEVLGLTSGPPTTDAGTDLP